jgi:hypothetical protein
VAVDGARNLLIADTGNDRVRVIANSSGSFYGQAMTAGDIYTVAGGGTADLGDGGPATSARVSSPAGVAVDGARNLLIAESGDGRIRVVAATTGSFYGQAMTAGHIYTVAGGAIQGLGDGGPATSAHLSSPQKVAVDGTGNLVIADAGNNRIRLVASRTGTFYGRAMTAGDIYTVAGNGTRAFSGDGGPATGAAIASPAGVAVDRAGNLVIADTLSWRIRVVAVRSGAFYGRAMTAGDIYTVAGDGTAGFSGDGGPATKAQLFDPGGVSLDGAGNLVIADTLNERVRVVAERTGTFYGQAMTVGDIYTVAGQNGGFSGDGGPGIRASLSFPGGVGVSGGNILIADSGNNRIRKIQG